MSTVSKMERVQRYAVKRGTEVVENLGKNNLWKRMLKNIMATTILGGETYDFYNKRQG